MTKHSVLKMILFVFIGFIEVFLIAFAISWFSNTVKYPIILGPLFLADPINPNNQTFAKGIFEHPLVPSIVFGSITYFIVRLIKRKK
jgi:hypothetical protein